MLSYQAKKASSLRKVKTDAVDAYALCELFHKEDFERHKTRGVQLLNLRNFTRQHDTFKLNFNFKRFWIRSYRSIKGVSESCIP
jgi:hypothetical protein